MLSSRTSDIQHLVLNLPPQILTDIEMTSDQLQEAYLEKADPLSVMRLLQALLVFEGSMANRNLDDDGGLLDDDDGGLEQGFNVMYPNDLMGGSSSTLPKWKFQDLDKLSDIISGRSGMIFNVHRICYIANVYVISF
eukprot:GHVO01065000.1.p2 GENE.GHVO01065000.1~~GHVO01065000.1.p2  ORF type:complete len:137 (-),score=25.88 GHVO01065000.1:802-1212(-)